MDWPSEPEIRVDVKDAMSGLNEIGYHSRLVLHQRGWCSMLPCLPHSPLSPRTPPNVGQWPACSLASCLLIIASMSFHAAATQPQAQDDGQSLGRVALLGQIPVEQYPAVQSKADRIWSYLVRRFALPDETPTPVVQFAPFALASQAPAWSVWQKDWIKTHPAIWRDWSAMQPTRSSAEVSVEWIDSHIDSVFPFPKNFLAFHYDGTNRIQIDPKRTFIDSMQVFIDGERRGRSGQGFYSLGHEMLHYALETRGVAQKKLHHCLMLYRGDAKDDASADALPPPALMEDVATHLVEEHIIAPIARLRGLRTEQSLRPCDRLTKDELTQVAEIHKRLAAPVTVPASAPGPAAGSSKRPGD